jgi:hypothetical protein
MKTIVEMPDGSEYTLKHLLSAANHKQQMGVGHVAVGLTLTPRATGRAGRNLCPFATKGCAGACFAGFDRMAWPQNKRAAVARTRFLVADPAAFQSQLKAELFRLSVRKERIVCRLNVVSDFPFEGEMPGLFCDLPRVQFMDYTKDVSRVLSTDRPPNYHLTFSRSERNENDCRRVLAAGHNVTVVFRRPPFPRTYLGFPVIDGDRSDFRFLEPSPRVVGLKAKGKGARNDATGFVIDDARRAMPLPMLVAA